MAMGVGWMVPIEIRGQILFEGIRRVPEHLGEMPVDKALNVVPAGLDTEVRNIFRQVDFRFELRKRLAQMRKGSQQGEGGLRIEIRDDISNVVVGKLPHRA